MAPFLCKTPLLLLGIIGLAATQLEIEEGRVALFVKKLQNITKHNFFHLEDRVRRYKCNSTLDQMRVIVGRKLNLENVSILIFLS
jgi:hypothetical protein